MALDIETIITSLTSSAVIAGAFAYVLKKSFDKTLELKFDQIKEKSKTEIAEAKRRKAEIFDQQKDTFVTVLSLAYRCRNSARFIIDQIEDKWADEELKERIDREDSWKGFESYSSALIQLLYEERAIMPPKLFSIVHEMKSHLSIFNSEVQLIIFRNKRADSVIREKLKKTFIKIDEMYNLITDEVQIRLGIEDSS